MTNLNRLFKCTQSGLFPDICNYSNSNPHEGISTLRSTRAVELRSSPCTRVLHVRIAARHVQLILIHNGSIVWMNAGVLQHGLWSVYKWDPAYLTSAVRMAIAAPLLAYSVQLWLTQWGLNKTAIWTASNTLCFSNLINRVWAHQGLCTIVLYGCTL